jgi:hypothetical protein
VRATNCAVLNPADDGAESGLSTPTSIQTVAET